VPNAKRVHSSCKANGHRQRTPHLASTITPTSRRLYHGRCQRRNTTTYRPLTALPTASTAFASLAKPVSGGDLSHILFVSDLEYDLPLIIIGGILQENPFFMPPDEFLRELHARGTRGNRSQPSSP
jgi:hypothetical protein